MASEYADIPRYLRYKDGDEGLDDDWDYELERANQILHTRIVRMHRDKLCKDCARFDWSRTHFYTREVHWIYEEGRNAGQILDDRYQMDDGYQPVSSFDLDYRDLENVRDDVVWSQFEVVAEAHREAKWLAKDPRFRWQLRRDQIHQCQLCKVLWNKAERAGEVLPELDDSNNSAFLNILLKGGPAFKDGGKHRCIVVSLW